MECPHLEDHVINIKSDLQKVFKAEKKWFCSGGWLVADSAVESALPSN